MAKTSKSVVLLTAVALLIVFAADRSTGPKAEGRASQDAEAPQNDACVLVEAFVVEVKVSALDGQGVSPIGQKPNAVSVENILDCLGGKDMAQVSTGLKVSLKSEANGEAETTETVYVERQVGVPGSRRADGRVPVVSKSFKNYDIGRQLSVRAFIRPDGRILVNFEFSQSTYRQIASDEEAPANTISRQWSGDTCLKPGEPAIVGSTQDQETAAFLVLCADIRGK